MKIKNQGVVELCRMIIETHSEDAEVLKQARNLLGVLSPLSASSAAMSSGAPTNISPYAPQQASRVGNSSALLRHSASEPSVAAPTTALTGATSSAKSAMSKKLRAQITQQQHQS
jgi:hypothetical protein